MSKTIKFEGIDFRPEIIAAMTLDQFINDPQFAHLYEYYNPDARAKKLQQMHAAAKSAVPATPAKGKEKE